MTKKMAFLFPGQGAQYVGMGKEFFDAFPLARETFEQADDLLKENLSKIIFEGPEDLLTQTKNSQLGIFVVSMAMYRVLGLTPAVCSGLSLGEYSALCVSERLSFVDTLLLVRERALRMNEACQKTSGAMAAVLGLDAEGIEQAVQGLEGIWVANYNAPGQTVVSGTKEGIEQAVQVLKDRGAKRVIPLAVQGAFHSKLMQSARDGLAPFIAKAPLQESSIDFVMNVPGDFVRDLEKVRRYLTEQVTESVRWEQGIRAMRGIDLFVEIGCGKTLSGLNRKIGVSVPTISIEKPSDIDLLMKELSTCNCC
jgi:[acyl-carrier-protein] S-malonyltransferase